MKSEIALSDTNVSPRIVVMLMVKNEQETLAQCISSLLKQSVEIQILVSNNHSIDNSERILQAFVEQSPKVLVLKPKAPLEQYENAKFIKDKSLELFPHVQFRIILGADDDYTDPRLIEELLKGYDKCISKGSVNIKSQNLIIVPKIRFQNVKIPAKSFDLKLDNSLNSESYLVRLLSLVLQPTSKGHFNFVLGLMSKEQMSEYIDNYFRIAAIENRGNARPIYSEYFATLKLLENNRIYFDDKVMMTKRIHNRIGSYVRLQESSKLEQTKLITALKRQFSQSLTFLKATFFLREYLQKRLFTIYLITGIIFFLVNFCNPVLLRIKIRARLLVQAIHRVILH